MTRRFGGTGLGLVLSHRTAEALGGNLDLVKGEPNKGSLFRLQLPIGIKNAVINLKQFSELPTARHPQSPRPVFNGPRLLLAEDSADNVDLFQAYLRNTGEQVEIAHSGAEAIKKAQNGSFDIVLMDIQMPVMDGLEAARRLRAQNYNVPLVALSAQALSDHVQRSLRPAVNRMWQRRSVVMLSSSKFKTCSKFNIVDSQDRASCLC